MGIDTTTARLLGSVLRKPSTRQVFRTIADRRITEATKLTVEGPQSSLASALHELINADLIGAGREDKYFVTARGLKVARDLDKL